MNKHRGRKKIIALTNKSITANEQRKFLSQLYSSAKNPKETIFLLRKAKEPQIKALCEISQTILSKKFLTEGTSKNQRKQLLLALLPYKSILRSLANRQISFGRKKRNLLEATSHTGGIGCLVSTFLAPFFLNKKRQRLFNGRKHNKNAEQGKSEEEEEEGMEKNE